MRKQLNITDKTRVRRLSERANYDEAAIFSVIDDSFFATIAFHDGHNPHAIPTAVWRENEHLYIHGSNGSRLLKVLQNGTRVCVSMTHMHGLVLARSAFNHSMNYSSVCLYGTFESVPEIEKILHMQYFLEHWLPGRWQHVRQPNHKELAATTIMRMAITEAVLKSRQGFPKDDISDMEQAVWAGVIPLATTWQPPQQVPEQNNGNLPGKDKREHRFYLS